MVDDLLFTDYDKAVRVEERGNRQKLGVLGRLNTIYIHQYLNPEWEVKEQYAEEFNKINAEYEAKL